MIHGIVASRLFGTPSPPGELETLLPNRTLGVLFYRGEKHPGGGGDLSDTEWDLAPGEGIQMPADIPYQGVIGQISYDIQAFILLAGGGPIEMLSGYYLHYLVQSGSVVQLIISNKATISPDNALDPETLDAFNIWWNSKGRQKVQFLNAAGEVVAEKPVSIPTDIPVEEGDDTPEPLNNRGAFLSGVPWAAPEDVVKIKLVPV